MTNFTDYRNEELDIKLMLDRCGVSPMTKGFGFLAKAIFLCELEPHRKISDIYSEIGADDNYDEHTVHNYTDYALNKAYDLCAFINETLNTTYKPYQLQNKKAVKLLVMCRAVLRKK